MTRKPPAGRTPEESATGHPHGRESVAVRNDIVKDVVLTEHERVALVIESGQPSIRLLTSDHEAPSDYETARVFGSIEEVPIVVSQHPGMEVSADKLSRFVHEQRGPIERIRQAHTVEDRDWGRVRTRGSLAPEGEKAAIRLQKAATEHDFATGRPVLDVNDWLDHMPPDEDERNVLSLEELAESSGVVVVGDIGGRLEYLRTLEEPSRPERVAEPQTPDLSR